MKYECFLNIYFLRYRKKHCLYYKHKAVNACLERIFAPKREDVLGGWRKLYGRNLRDLYPALNIVTFITLQVIKRMQSFSGKS